MSFTSVAFNRVTLTVSFIVVLCAIFLQDHISLLFMNIKKLSGGKVAYLPQSSLFTVEDLAQYDGIVKEALYLTVMGTVFDVTQGRKHYEKGAPYNFFVGRDGSRSFITGNFSDVSEDKDHVLDLSCEDLQILTDWRDTYRKRYTYKGKLIGRYYDSNGTPTAYMKEVKSKIKQCKIEEKMADESKQKFPSCNVEWSLSDGTRVWCTKNSGGITRNWVGVPRQLYIPGEEKPHCVCVDLSMNHSGVLLKEYEDCQQTSATCIVKNK